MNITIDAILECHMAAAKAGWKAAPDLEIEKRAFLDLLAYARSVVATQLQL